MEIATGKPKITLKSFFKHDFKSGITVFFVALPLCLGISLASGAPVYSGLIAGIVGGIMVALLSGSELSVSGPAAGLTAICLSAISDLGSLEAFFLAVMAGGIIQLLLGLMKLGGFTHLIPSAVIKGMLSAIGVILISKQFPLMIGYDQPDFWTNELFNIITLDHAFQHLGSIYDNTSLGVILISVFSFLVLMGWKRWIAKSVPYIPASFVTVLAGSLVAFVFSHIESLRLGTGQYVSIPLRVFSSISLDIKPDMLAEVLLWKYAFMIAVVASLETLLSIEAVDKLDPRNRITPQNRELMAQGSGNIVSGLLGGLPITAVIVRGSANIEAGAVSKWSSVSHGLWLLLAMAIAVPLLNYIPYCVLAVILVRTGYNLVKPGMILSVWNQGREQFLPFMITVISILLTDLLIGVLIGIAWSLYFLVKHTYRAGFVIVERPEGHTTRFVIQLALNVSFLNKKRIKQALDQIPSYAIVEIDGSKSVYIDHDILEIFQEFRSKAHIRHIQVEMKNIPEVQIIEVH